VILDGASSKVKLRYTVIATMNWWYRWLNHFRKYYEMRL